MDCREDHHGRLVRVVTRDALIHVKEIAVALFDRVLTVTLNRVAEIEEYTETSAGDASTLVTGFLRCSRGNIPRRKIAKARVFTLKVVISIVLGHSVWVSFTLSDHSRDLCVLWGPNTTVITK